MIEVLDGDTVIVAFADGSTDTVRLLGVDPPETHHPRKPVQCFGPEACADSRKPSSPSAQDARSVDGGVGCHG